MKQILRYGLILFLVCSIAAGVLAFTYENTQKVIEINKKLEKEKILKEMIPEATEFKKVENLPKVENKLVKINEINIAYKGQEKIGSIWEVVSKGYSSDIILIIGINKEGKIEHISVLSQQETPGLGSEITKDSFLKQFIGKDTPNLEAQKNITPVSGATISSSAVVRAVNEVLKHKDF
jgi:electron transport complex protein RnfG